MSVKPRPIVTFEVPPAVLQALVDDATLRGASSPHLRAREILVDHFANREAGELRERLAELEKDVAYLGELVRRTTYSVIVHAGQRTSQQANEWIREHMPRTRD
ncbi:MAG TPA: hypothetical protein PJ982_15000 [Lacipirellulaceae bacterium]|nr:hypothetical protein [Lacipirellulaceae bacterium]